MLSRRHVLTLLAAAPVLPSCAGQSLPDPVAAWRHPGAGERDPRRYALAHAILAPNPHNRQPWLVDLIGASEIALYPDVTRLLPETDPFNRQITVGCGAFLELLSIAAAERGLVAQITPFPEGEPQPHLDQRPFAHVKLTPGGARDPLFAAILARRTNRKPYEARAVPAADLEALAQSAAAPGLRTAWANGGQTLAALRDLAWEGVDLEAHTPHAHQETARLLRVGHAEIAAHRDGIAIEGPMIELAKALGLVTPEVLANPDHRFTKPSLDAWRPLAEEVPVFFWLTSADNARAAQIAAGRAYARLNLTATARGLAMHPFSQSLQEYPEMARTYAEMERLTGARPGERVQMLVRVGYGPVIPPAPRRGLEDQMRA